MNAYFLPGAMGMLVGLLLRWTGFAQTDHTRLALALRRGDSRRCQALRSGLTAIGWGLILTALLCWLAVIDVDTIEVLPLSLGVLAGGALLGIAAGLCGATPMSAFAVLGGGNALEALCVLAGCWGMTLLLPSLETTLTPLQTAEPYLDATLFRVTLDEPWVAEGGFLGQACVGAMLAVIGLCIPSPQRADAPVPAGEELAPPASSEEEPEEAPVDPESAPEETFVALLEGEEPLVVDTAEVEAVEAESSAEKDEEPTPEE